LRYSPFCGNLSFFFQFLFFFAFPFFTATQHRERDQGIMRSDGVAEGLPRGKKEQRMAKVRSTGGSRRGGGKQQRENGCDETRVR
jgi:hypothetical protein